MKTFNGIVFLVFVSFVSFCQNYFQQEVKYNIHVRLDTVTPSLKGKVSIIYTNLSPNTLNYLYFLLHPNSTSHPTKTALAKQLLQSNKWKLFFSDSSKRGYIDSLNFKVNNEPVFYKILKDTPDVAIVYLKHPLYPKQSILIETPFYVKIPKLNITRLGFYENIYSITQWYPKLAVYDKEGWHPLSYLKIGEFYSEFAHYTVHIEVPENFTVAATGILNTESEKIRIEKIVNNTKHNLFIPQSLAKGYKTLTFIQDSIHDFAWFTSPNFMILKDSVVIDKNTVYCWAYFTPQSYTLWKDAASYVAQAVKFYSEQVGAYPYKHCTAVETPNIIDGGMEYPTITNIGKYEDKESLFFVILHEVGHNWFYGILANNERKYPWIDEGINSYYDNYNNFNLSNSTNRWKKLFDILDFDKIPNQTISDYFYSIGSAKPIGLHSNQYSFTEYFFNTYYNASTAWFLLKKQMGDSTYQQFIKSLYKQYAFKHIYTDDIKNHISKFTNKNTDWFFKHYLYTTKRSDYKIKKIIQQDNKNIIIVKNKNKTLFPYTITLYNNNKPIFFSIREGSLLDSITTTLNFNKVILNDHNNSVYFFESNYQNNIYNKRFLFPNLKKPSIKYANILNYQDKYDISVLPIVSYTYTDKRMIGLLFHSPFIPYSPFQIRLLPLYSLDNKILNFNLHSEYLIPVNRKLKYFRIYSNFKQFSLPENQYLQQWTRLNVGLDLPFEQTLTLKKTLTTPFFEYTFSTLPFYPYKTEHYANLGLNVKNKIFVYPFELTVSNEFHKQFAKFSVYSNYFIPYNEKKKGIFVEYFFGSFYFNNSRIYLYNFFLSGRNGVNDYTYKETFINRFSHISSQQFWTHQFILAEGLFTTYTPIQSNKWMTSVRTSIAMPIPPPIYWYFTAATYHKAGKAWTGSTSLPFESGIEFRLIKHIFAIYFPVFMSKDVKQLSNNYSRHYFDKVRFMLRFNMLNPLHYSKNFHELF